MRDDPVEKSWRVMRQRRLLYPEACPRALASWGQGLSKNLLAGAGRKPGSVPALPPVVVIPLGRPLPDGSCDQLEIESTRATPAGCPAISDRSCSRWGLPYPPRHRGRGALLPHRFTLTGPCGPAVYFLLHCPSSHPDWPLASTLPCGARTFLDGRPKGPPRPPVRLEREAGRL